MSDFCVKCGRVLSDDSMFCAFCGAGQPAKAIAKPDITQNARPQPGKSILRRVAIITAVAVVIICTASYFLFFADKPMDQPLTFAASATPSAIPSVEASASVSVTPFAETSASTSVTPSVESSSAATVSGQTITVSMAYDSGEGVYSGDIKDGVPHGSGSFNMVKSNSGKQWSYEGQWVNGESTGEGTLTQGALVFKGTFKGGILNGGCEITDGGILRYKGECKDGQFHGQGTLYTRSGTLIFEGKFENDMLAESAAERQKRGNAFIPKCINMDADLYEACLAEHNTFDTPVAVWGFVLGMSDQNATGTVILGHMGEDSYPICISYRYGKEEPKMQNGDWINAWGIVVGNYEYTDSNGKNVTCPKVEVIIWNNEQEGL